MDIRVFQVGGSVRDELLGLTTKDIDFSVEAPSFDAMREFMVDKGFNIFQERPQYLTIRARFPKGSEHERMVADFVLARKDGAYSDGRRPDEVKPGTLIDDLARRDFTVNAIARTLDGSRLIDPFGGVEDLKNRVLRCVGNAEDRLREDALRALRAYRFMVTKGFKLERTLYLALRSGWLPPLVAEVADERKRDELHKMFVHDNLKTLLVVSQMTNAMQRAIFKDNLWLTPSLKKRK
jgi:tRNA nucleotidyltransferase (CCA-adding enzyme)